MIDMEKHLLAKDKYFNMKSTHSELFSPSNTDFLEFDVALVWSRVVVNTTIARKYLEMTERMNNFWTSYQSSIIKEYKTVDHLIRKRSDHS